MPSRRCSATSARSMTSRSRSGEGEFFTMLGPSGCGKTTTLRMIAGFEEPTRGEILLRGRDDHVQRPAARRNVNMVFQNYALFPHMTRADNVAFGLRCKKVAGRRRRSASRRRCEMVRLAGLREAHARPALRRPAAARRAGARARQPARGAAARRAARRARPEAAQGAAARAEALQRRLETTFVYVTHDQEEALTMSDRIAVMKGGSVEQIGAPRESTSSRRRRSWPASSASRT